jgi:hypothetical protein
LGREGLKVVREARGRRRGDRRCQILPHALAPGRRIAAKLHNVAGAPLIRLPELRAQNVRCNFVAEALDVIG